jgi:hypothetical protein
VSPASRRGACYCCGDPWLGGLLIATFCSGRGGVISCRIDWLYKTWQRGLLSLARGGHLISGLVLLSPRRPGRGIVNGRRTRVIEISNSKSRHHCFVLFSEMRRTLRNTLAWGLVSNRSAIDGDLHPTCRNPTQASEFERVVVDLVVRKSSASMQICVLGN